MSFILNWLILEVIFEIALRTLEHLGENGLYEIRLTNFWFGKMC